MSGSTKPSLSFTCMDKFFQNVFSVPVAVAVGIGVVSVLVTLIVSEESVQPLREHTAAKESVSVPLSSGVVFSQEVTIPQVLNNQSFLLGVLFGCREEGCLGSMEVTLSQGTHSQVRSVFDIRPAPTLRHQFRFSGFSSGSAILEVRGLPNNDHDSPGILYIKEGEGNFLRGPDIPEPAYISIDWFKVVSGEQKLGTVFASKALFLHDTRQRFSRENLSGHRRLFSRSQWH